MEPGVSLTCSEEAAIRLYYVKILLYIQYFNPQTG
jgi:hypothetical protein